MVLKNGRQCNGGGGGGMTGPRGGKGPHKEKGGAHDLLQLHVSVEPCMPGEFLGFESGGLVLIGRRRVLL